LANAELRAWKKRAHKAFDPLWQREAAFGTSNGKARAEAYVWLAEQLGIPASACHIGMFGVEACKKVVAIIAEKLSPTTKNTLDTGR
jgi:hypothetical protein